MTSDIELTNHIHRVASFMRQAGQTLPTVPADPGEKVRRARVLMLVRKVLEHAAGMGFAVTVTPVTDPKAVGIYPYGEKMHRVSAECVHPFNMVEAIDGTRDVQVVGTGTDMALGVADPSVYQRIDHANLRKFQIQYIIDPITQQNRKATREECKANGLGGYLEWEGTNAGKWIKPANWRDVMPEIAEQLRKDGYVEADTTQ